MRRCLLLLLLPILLTVVVPAVNSDGFAVTINSINYPKKVHPNENFSISAVVVSNAVNGWAKVKLYFGDEELKASDGVWYGLLGANAGENNTITMSDVTLSPSSTPYSLEIVAFWQPLGQRETRQATITFTVTVVSLTLTADCLPNSVNASENFILHCSVANTGNDAAHAVDVAISNYGDFSPRGELHQGIGDLAAGQSKVVDFNMSSPFAIYPSAHGLTLQITYRDFSDMEFSVNQPLSIKVDLTPVASLNGTLTIAPEIILIVVVFILVYFAIVGRRVRVNRGGVWINK